MQHEKDIQNKICQHISTLGWELHFKDSNLGRPSTDVAIYSELESALLKLNPQMNNDPARANQVISKLKAIFLSTHNDGLIAANEELTYWLCGRRTIQYIGDDKRTSVKLIDFTNLENNTYKVSSEATFTHGTESRRYDVVLYVNGLPIIVGEIKSPSRNTSWLNAAIDIHDGYELKTAPFFVPNLLSFATDGKEFRCGAIRNHPKMWLNWSKTTDDIMQQGMNAVLRSVELLLTPEMVLDILRHYVRFSSKQTQMGAVRCKIIPRYPQVEAVDKIIDRCTDPSRHKGLIWHHQGSGKTYAMAYAASKLRHIPSLEAPTIIVVLDRREITQQTIQEFKSIDTQGIKVASSIKDLRELLSGNVKGIVITTIHKFREADFVNKRSNIILLIDEAHRTQEGSLAEDMRAALPNAKFIGLTGTPVQTSDKDTWALFGHKDDENDVMNHYDMKRSIQDGATVPLHVESRLVDFQVDEETLQQEWDQLVEDEEWDEETEELFKRKSSEFSVIVKHPLRVDAVCRDIIKHYRENMSPMGLKAQIVAYDRETCVLYQNALQEMLEDGEESTIVMTASKNDPEEWSVYDRSADEEKLIKSRYLEANDPLKFIIVTAKLLTGFDAPIEGVMYLDKPLTSHTLFQAICRTNRRWVNKDTGQEKEYGLIVDYMGIGEELKDIITSGRKDQDEDEAITTQELLAEFNERVDTLWYSFPEIDKAASQGEQVFLIENIVHKGEKEDFAHNFLRCQSLYEFLHPKRGMGANREKYFVLAKAYETLTPNNPNKVLWHAVGAKTKDLVNRNVSKVDVEVIAHGEVIFDHETLADYEEVNDLFTASKLEESNKEQLTAQEVLNRLDDRIMKRMKTEDPHHVWQTLTERLQALRDTKITQMEKSVEFLREIAELAKDLTRAVKADEEGELDSVKVLNSKEKAMSKIFESYAPDYTPAQLAAFVEEIDSILSYSMGTGWQESDPGNKEVRRELRYTLGRFGYKPKGELFDTLYEYIRTNY